MYNVIRRVCPITDLVGMSYYMSRSNYDLLVVIEIEYELYQNKLSS